MFQNIMEKLLHGIPRVSLIDDILITGASDEDQLVTLGTVLKILSENGLRLKKEKCKFMVRAVYYLCYHIDKQELTLLKPGVLYPITSMDAKAVK